MIDGNGGGDGYATLLMLVGVNAAVTDSYFLFSKSRRPAGDMLVPPRLPAFPGHATQAPIGRSGLRSPA